VQPSQAIDPDTLGRGVDAGENLRIEAYSDHGHARVIVGRRESSSWPGRRDAILRGFAARRRPGAPNDSLSSLYPRYWVTCGPKFGAKIVNEVG
jgi:hypothetical protein